MHPLFKAPDDLLGRFRWGLLGFYLLNLVGMLIPLLSSHVEPTFRAAGVVAIVALGGIGALAYRRGGPHLLHNLFVIGGMVVISQGFNQPRVVQGLIFAWLTVVQLYGPWPRALLRFALLQGMWFTLFGLLSKSPAANEVSQVIGVGMASLFSFALGASLRKVQANEARFRSLVQNASDLIVVTGQKGELIYLSPRAEAALGAKAGAGTLVELVHEDDRAAFEHALTAATQGTEVQRVELKLKSGRDYEALVSNRLSDEHTRGLVLNVRDVTERKRADAELRKREAELHDAQHEVEIAARIQTALLPGVRTVAGFELASLMLPAADVGGDYLDIIPVDRALYIGVGDVAGHGLTSGLIMLMTQSAVAGLVTANPRAAPSEIVRNANRVLYENIHHRLRAQHHVTFTLLRLGDDGKVQHAGAHEDLMVKRARTGQLERVFTPGTWLGGVPDISAGTFDSQLQLEPGDVLLLHTDGITEARNGQAEEYGPERLGTRLLELTAPERPANVEALCRALADDVERFSPTRADDRSLVVVRYLGLPSDVRHADQLGREAGQGVKA